MIKKLASRIVYENKWMKVREDNVEFANGSKGIYGVVEKSDAAMIIPEVSQDVYVLVRPYRYTIGKALWEFPHGSLEGEKAKAEKIARQELQEETGYTAQKIDRLSTLHIAYGYSTQVVHIFLAKDLVSGENKREVGELDMEVKTFSAQQIEDLIVAGEITDTQTIAAWSILKLKT